jgi:hypothetical protein
MTKAPESHDLFFFINKVDREENYCTLQLHTGHLTCQNLNKHRQILRTYDDPTVNKFSETRLKFDQWTNPESKLSQVTRVIYKKSLSPINMQGKKTNQVLSLFLV